MFTWDPQRPRRTRFREMLNRSTMAVPFVDAEVFHDLFGNLADRKPYRKLLA